MNIFFTYKHLQDELKAQGLPWSRTYLTILENMGKISKPKNVLYFHRQNITGHLSSRDMRIFTLEDIQKIVNEVKVYKQNSK